METTLADSPRGSAVLAPRYQARRTKARPKQTLFGSNMENVVNTSTLEELMSNRSQKMDCNVRRYTPKLPEHMKKNIPGQEGLLQAKEQYQRMKSEAAKASNDLKSLEENTLYFHPPLSSKQNDKMKSEKNPLWFTKKDVENAKNINCLGLNSHESYNHNKYGKKPPTEHKYKLMGDILQPKINNGMVSRSHTVDAIPSRKENCNNNSDVDDSPQIPICRCYATISFCRNQQCLTCSRPRMNTNVLTKNLKEQYEDLSNVQRTNCFSGYTLHQYESLTKDVHTEDVFLMRDAPPDEFRARKDAYSVWAEANLVREKLKKKWIEADARKKNS